MKSPHKLAEVPNKVLLIVGEILAVARKNRQWRQLDLAERLGVTRQTIARMERGEASVAVGVYFEAAWLLDVPILPGMELRRDKSQDALSNLIMFLKKNLPQRISGKPEKPIDDKF